MDIKRSFGKGNFPLPKFLRLFRKLRLACRSSFLFAGFPSRLPVLLLIYRFSFSFAALSSHLPVFLSLCRQYPFLLPRLEIVEEGIAFPQEECLTLPSGATFFANQTYVAVARDSQTCKLMGLYILHPNNVGRCGHIANASYAVGKQWHGLHIGEKLVLDCLRQAKAHGFRVLQFNAVVATNFHARHLYERLGFVQLGVIPGGFRMKDGTYADICPYYHCLQHFR